MAFGWKEDTLALSTKSKQSPWKWKELTERYRSSVEVFVTWWTPAGWEIGIQTCKGKSAFLEKICGKDARFASLVMSFKWHASHCLIILSLFNFPLLAFPSCTYQLPTNDFRIMAWKRIYFCLFLNKSLKVEPKHTSTIKDDKNKRYCFGSLGVWGNSCS